MKEYCKFSPERDIQPTQQGLETNIKMAIETGAVADTGLSLSYNFIEEPSQIKGRVSDVFDAILAHRQILANGRITESSTSGSQQTGSASAASSAASSSTSSEG